MLMSSAPHICDRNLTKAKKNTKAKSKIKHLSEQMHVNTTAYHFVD